MSAYYESSGPDHLLLGGGGAGEGRLGDNEKKK